MAAVSVFSAGLALATTTLHAEIVIGGLLETSGPVASLGAPGLAGAELAVKQVNEAGGIDGEQVRFININTESDNTASVSATRKLISQEKVVGIIGAMNSGSSYAIIDFVQRAGVPLISNGGSRGIALPAEEKPFIFVAPLTDLLVQSVILSDMKAKGITKIAVLNSDSGFGTSGEEQLEHHVAEYGIEIVSQKTFGNSDTDMTPQLLDIRNSDAQAVVLWSTGPAQAIATRNFRQLELDLPFYLSHAANDFNFIKLTEGAADGVLIPSSKLYVKNDLPDSDLQKAAIETFASGYEAEYGQAPATFAGNGYDAAMLLMQAIDAADSTDPKLIRDALEATKDHVGVTAVYSYSPEDHFGAQADSVVMLTVKDGNFAIEN
jgi:branched-chain amino acid transport system substrate-binding protein